MIARSSSPPLSSPPSSPLSSLGRSPSPPADYPSPPSSSISDTGTSSQSRDATDEIRPDGAPAKRQKMTKSKEPRELKTEYLNLRTLNDSDSEEHHASQDPKLRKLIEALRLKRKIVVIAGAGISVSAGIPDFRSSGGLFNTLRGQHKLKASGKHLFDASVYRNDSSTSSFHDMVRELSHKTQNAEPTAFHHMLATLAEEGRLLRLYTQNVDGIDTSLAPLSTNVPLNPKGPWPKSIQLHGGLGKMVCTKCGKLSDFNGSLFEGPEAPSCPECETNDGNRLLVGLRSHGIGRLRPRMVLYNEYNPDEDAIGNVSHADLKTRPDAVIVVGTSLKIPGIRRLARELCAVTRGKRGGFTAWINQDPEPIGIDVKDSWDMVVQGDCDDVARFVGLPRWDDKDCGDYKLINTAAKETKPEVAVVLDKKPLSALNTQGMLTPTDSPRQQSPTPVNVSSKLKQTPLSFAAAKPARTKDGKLKKKPGRKPLPSKPMPTSNKITNSFATTKKTEESTEKNVISKEQIEKPANPLFPGLNPDLTSAVPPLSSDNACHAIDPTSFQPETSKLQTQIFVSTPKYERSDNSYDREGTISPKSKPKGMAALII